MRATRVLLALVFLIASCGGDVPIPQDCRLLGCPSGLVCTQGADGAWSCQEPPPCSDDNPCPNGQVCVNGKCEAPPPWQCPLPFPGCHVTGQSCSNPPDARCWHNPTTNPEFCEEAPLCTAPPPGPACPRGFPQGQDQELTGGPVMESHAAAVDAAMQDLTGCAIGDWSCSTGMSPDDWMHAVIQKLKEEGLCAGRHIDTTPGGTDEIAVTDDCTGWWEGYKVYNYTPGQRLIWSAQGKRGAWKLNNPEACGAPGPPPPPGGECVDPDPTGLEAQFVLKKHVPAPVWDSTYRKKGRTYCDQVCSPLEPAVCYTGRLWCPMRFPGDPELAACTAKHIGVQQWWCDGEKIEPTANPAQAACAGHVKTCTEDGLTCGEADW